MYNCEYDPNVIFSFLQYVFGNPRMMDDKLSSLDIPYLDGSMFKKVIMSCTRDLVINFVNFL